MEERKVVTVVFCDLVGSTELSGRIDVELLRTILLRYYALMRSCVEEHAGVVEKFIGDAVMAVFGLVVREDDARRALTAALAMLDALEDFDTALAHDHGLRLSARIGVHTGEVVAGAAPARRQALVSGEVVNIAARLQAAAEPGQVLLSAATRAAAGPGLSLRAVGPLDLKGISAPVEAFRLLAAPAEDPDAARRFDVPFVGRRPDLDTLDLMWGRAVASGDAQTVTILGEAGIGKTRLVTEWLLRRGQRAVLGRCRTSGGGSLAPLAQCLAPLVDALPDRDADVAAAVALLRAGLLVDGTPSPSQEDTCEALADVVGALAAEAPVLLVVDDCHLAEPTLMAVLARLVEDLDRSPLMAVCAARPELLDRFPDWGARRSNAATVTLGPLPDADSALLASHLVDVAPHDSALIDRLVERADGNPWYLEQLGAAAHENGDNPDRVPPGMRALVAARIDGLDAAERTTLRHAAVIGGEFTAADVRCLAGPGDEQIAARLRSLARRRFLAAVRRGSRAGAAYEFASAVTQRVAYDGLTKQTRSELHQAYAECLVIHQGPDDDVGGHFEAAHRLLGEIGLRNDHTERLRSRAAEHLARAGSTALRRVDLPKATALLGRAVALSDAADARRPERLLRLGMAFLTLGSHQDADALLRRAAAEARDPAVAAHAELCLLRDDVRALAAAAARALPVFAERGDDLGLARALLVGARSAQRRGQHARALEELQGALSHAVAAEADQELANTLGAVGMSLWHGPVPVPAAVERCEGLLAEHQRAAVQATLGFPLTALLACAGQTRRAHRSLEATLRAVSGLSYAEARVFRPLLTALVTDDENGLDEAYRAARGGPLAGFTALELARRRLQRSRWREAAGLIADVTPGDDWTQLAGLSGLRAWITAFHGDVDGATRLAAAAEAAARRTDSPIAQATASLDRAHAEAVLGRPGPAGAAAEEARRLFAGKGDLRGVARADELLAALGAHRHGRRNADGP